VLPPRFVLYQALSEHVMGVLGEVAPVVEPVSLDEAFLEPPQLAGASVAEVELFATQLRADVRTATGLPASVGAGPGKQAAKIASDLAKPDGLRIIDPAEQQNVLGPLPVRVLWGIGPVAEAALHRAGVQTVGELAALDPREAGRLLGNTVGSELHRLARGVDDRPVAPRGAAKSVGAETTFDVDLTGMSAVRDAVAKLAESAHRRLLASGRAARTVTVKVRSADFTTATRSETSAQASTDLGTFTAVAQRLAVAAVPPGGVRLLGVSLAGLGDEPPPALFTTAPEPALPGAVEPAHTPQIADLPRPWRTGDDVAHPEHGHGWVQGAGHGRVTVRFETRGTGPGRAITFAAEDQELRRAEALASLA
jgi:DNA polymerase-4